MDGVIGVIWMFAGNFAPRSWAFCDGQLLAISSNDALFSILGTTYGGDGRTTFGLPDLRGRSAIHAGRGAGLSDRRLGQRGGSETNTLNANQLASHTHLAQLTAQPQVDIPVHSVAGNEDEANPAGGVLTNSGADNYTSEAADASYGGAAIPTTGGAITVLPTGGNQPINNMQPWLAVNSVICQFGIYPSRN